MIVYERTANSIFDKPLIFNTTLPSYMALLLLRIQIVIIAFVKYVIY